MSTEASVVSPHEATGDQRLAILLAMAMFVLVVDHDTPVRVVGPCAESRGHRLLAELPHRPYLRRLDISGGGGKSWLQWPARAGGGIGRRARLRALWG